MVNFVDAFKALNNGYAVRREPWDKIFLYMHPKTGLIFFYDPMQQMPSRQPAGTEERYRFYADDFLAQWEILPYQTVTLSDNFVFITRHHVKDDLCSASPA